MSEIWENFLPKNSGIQSFLLNKEKMDVIYKEVFSTKDFYNYCKIIASDFLKVDKCSGRSNYTVNEAIKLLISKTSCSKTFAMKVVVSLINNEYRVET